MEQVTGEYSYCMTRVLLELLDPKVTLGSVTAGASYDYLRKPEFHRYYDSPSYKKGQPAMGIDFPFYNQDGGPGRDGGAVGNPVGNRHSSPVTPNHSRKSVATIPPGELVESDSSEELASGKRKKRSKGAKGRSSVRDFEEKKRDERDHDIPLLSQCMDPAHPYYYQAPGGVKGAVDDFSGLRRLYIGVLYYDSPAPGWVSWRDT